MCVHEIESERDRDRYLDTDRQTEKIRDRGRGTDMGTHTEIQTDKRADFLKENSLQNIELHKNHNFPMFF